MKKSNPSNLPERKFVEDVTDFTNELSLLEQMRSQIRSLLGCGTNGEKCQGKDFESDETLSFSSKKTLNVQLLSEHHEIRQDLKDISDFASSYHSVVQDQLRDLN